MKKKRIALLLLAFALLLTGMPVRTGRAHAEEAEAETETETEDPYPASYYLPIESNEVEGWPQGPVTEAEAAVLMDADTGALLYSKNAEAKEYPASITKIMTCLVALENGNLDDVITFSTIVYDIEEGSSHSGIKPGEEMTLRDALYCLMLASANDAANGIAEYIAGSVDAFAELMNAKAAELGCVNTHFVNPHGLYNDDHYTCAADMARIAQAAYKNSEFRKIVGTIYYEVEPTNMTEETRYLTNHCKMLYDDTYYYEYCVGGKTGYTEDCLNTLVTYAKKDKRTLISVVLRINGAYKSYDTSTALFNYGFDNFKRLRVRLGSYNETFGELAGANYLSTLSSTYDESLSQKVMNKKKSVVVDAPANLKSGDITKTYASDGNIYLTYGGWDLGSTAYSFNSLSGVTAKQPELTEGTARTAAQKAIEAAQTEAVPENETIKEKALRIGGNVWETVVEWVTQTAWPFLYEKAKTFENWVTENDLTAAFVVLILIIILIPVLVIAWARDSRARRIRKARKKEKAERVQIEQEIDTKSVSEIEQELRAELEKDRERREKEAENAREEAELAQAERLVEEKEALKEAGLEPEKPEEK